MIENLRDALRLGREESDYLFTSFDYVYRKYGTDPEVREAMFSCAQGENLLNDQRLLPINEVERLRMAEASSEALFDELKQAYQAK